MAGYFLLLMTLTLVTESHGDIDAGFYSSFTQFARLGEYTFATIHLCDLIKRLAEQPDIKNSEILGYNSDKFRDREEKYRDELVQIIAKAGRLYSPESQIVEIEREIERNQREIPLEDEVDLFNEGRMVPVKIADDDSTITIEPYRISATHFGIFAAYLAHGGWSGLLNDKKPYSEPAIEALKKSERGLYRKIRQELQRQK